MKFLLSTLLLVVCLGLVASKAKTSNRSWGKRSPSDHLLLRKEVLRSAKLGAWTVNVKYPEHGTSQKTISAVFAFDLSGHGFSAFPSLWSGGPGEKDVTVVLRSLPHQSINATVEVWGK